MAVERQMQVARICHVEVSAALSESLKVLERISCG